MHTIEAPVTPEALSDLPLFQGESVEELSWLPPVCPAETFPAGYLLLSPERFADCMYVVLDGEIQVQLDAKGERIVTRLGAGHCVGEMSVIEALPPSAYVVTVVPTRLLAIDGTTLRTILSYSSRVAENLLQMVCRRLRKDNLLLGRSLVERDELEAQAWVDALTGLYNRHWFDQSLRVLIQHCRYRGARLSLLMLDADHFKQYNDTHGHLAGDLALSTFAQAVRAHLRPGDHAARYGGEEIAVLLPEATLEEASRVAQKVLTAVREQTIHDRDGTPLPGISASIGVAQWQAGESAAALIARADGALYLAKHAGRDQVCLAR
ncbi:MAG: GGDEF domain-containing protein [Gammaproteobacteria bacterium]